MSEKDNEKDLKVNVHETIVLSDHVDAEVIKVTAAKKDGVDRSLEFPTDVSSVDIVTASTAATTTTLPPEQVQQLVETVDYAKTHKPFISELEISINFKDGFKFRVKREPSKVIKSSKKS